MDQALAGGTRHLNRSHDGPGTPPGSQTCQCPLGSGLVEGNVSGIASRVGADEAGRALVRDDAGRVA